MINKITTFCRLKVWILNVFTNQLIKIFKTTNNSTFIKKTIGYAPPGTRKIVSFQSILKSAIYQKYFFFRRSMVLVMFLANFKNVHRAAFIHFFTFVDISGEDGGTLPKNSYKPFRDL